MPHRWGCPALRMSCWGSWQLSRSSSSSNSRTGTVGTSCRGALTPHRLSKQALLRAAVAAVWRAVVVMFVVVVAGVVVVLWMPLVAMAVPPPPPCTDRGRALGASC